MATATSSSDWWKGHRRPVAQRKGLHFCVSRTCSMGCCPDNISAHCQFVQPAGPLGSTAGLSALNGGSGEETKAFSGGGVDQCQPRDNARSCSFPEYTLLSHAVSCYKKSKYTNFHLIEVYFFLLASRNNVGRRYTHRCHQAQVPTLENRRNEKKPR